MVFVFSHFLILENNSCFREQKNWSVTVTAGKTRLQLYKLVSCYQTFPSLFSLLYIFLLCDSFILPYKNSKEIKYIKNLNHYIPTVPERRVYILFYFCFSHYSMTAVLNFISLTNFRSNNDAMDRTGNKVGQYTIKKEIGRGSLADVLEVRNNKKRKNCSENDRQKPIGKFKSHL